MINDLTFGHLRGLGVIPSAQCNPSEPATTPRALEVYDPERFLQACKYIPDGEFFCRVVAEEARVIAEEVFSNDPSDGVTTRAYRSVVSAHQLTIAASYRSSIVLYASTALYLARSLSYNTDKRITERLKKEALKC